MATRYTTTDVIELLEDDDFGLSGEEESIEGDGIASYLTSAVQQLSVSSNAAVVSQ